MALRTGILLAGILAAAAGCRTAPPPDRAAHTLSPDDVRLAQALAYYAQGLLLEADDGDAATNAVAAYEQAIALDPARERLHSKLALHYLVRRDYDAALAVLERACRANPDSPQPWIDLALTSQLAGHTARAIEAFETARRLGPSDAFVYDALTRMYLQQDNDEAALRTIRQGLRHGNPRNLLLLATARAQRLAGREAVDAALPYLHILADHPETRSPAIFNLLGRLHLLAQRPAEAEQAFREAAAFPDPPPEAFVTLASVVLQQDRSAEAVAILESARSRYTNSPALLFSLALAQGAHGDDHAALATYAEAEQRVLDEGETPSEAFFLSYGAACEQAGRLYRAEAIFERCVAEYPESHEALNYLAYLWAEQNVKLDRALDYVNRALALEPDNGAYVDTLGWIYYRQGRYLDALVQVSRADRLVPDDPVVNDHLGDIHDALDHREEAVAHWTRSLRLDPSNAEVAFKLDAYGVDAERIRRKARRK